MIEVKLAGAVVRVSCGMDSCAADRGAACGSRLGVPNMINIPAGARVLLATRPVDFRKGAHGLAALAQEVLAEDPFSGAVIVWRSKRSDRVKILGLGHQRPGADLEAVAAGLVPLAADHGRRDEALAGGVRRAVRRARLDACSDRQRGFSSRRLPRRIRRVTRFATRRHAEPARRYRGIARAGAGDDGRA